MVGIELAFVVRLLAAVVLGSIIGLERSIAGKHAGMRTYALVSLGSSLFTMVGVLASYQFIMFSSVNPLHLAGFVAVGIGFIGAGLAALRSEDHVELTTTAGIWVVSAVGMACGFGYYAVAIATAVLAIIIFSFFSRIERSVRRRYGKEGENGVE